MLSPLKEIKRGLASYIAGVRWLKSHPKYFGVLLLPILLSLVFIGIGWSLFINYDDVIFQWILFERPDAYLWLVLYYLCKALLYIAFIVFSSLSGILLANILACPFYELVSLAIERDLHQGKVEEISIWQSLRLIPEELKKVLFILCVSLFLLFIPGLNVISFVISAFLVGWDFYDYPLARRGLRFRQRLQFVLGDSLAVTAFGLWLVIPFVQFLLMPLAIAGGTMLSLQSIDQRLPRR